MAFKEWLVRNTDTDEEEILRVNENLTQQEVQTAVNAIVNRSLDLPLDQEVFLVIEEVT